MSDDYTWRRATRCGESGQCVEVGWRKSSRSSESANCVEVAGALVTVAVRDSKDPEGPVLRFPRGAWVEFVAGLRAGSFDR